MAFVLLPKLTSLSGMETEAQTAEAVDVQNTRCMNLCGSEAVNNLRTNLMYVRELTGRLKKAKSLDVPNKWKLRTCISVRSTYVCGAPMELRTYIRFQNFTGIEPNRSSYIKLKPKHEYVLPNKKRH